MNAVAHVAVCPFPFASHPGGGLLLARKLAASTPDICFTFFLTEQAAKSINVVVGTSEGNILFRRVDDGDTEGKGRNPLEKIEMFVKSAGRSFRSGMKAAEEEVGLRVSCVVSEAFLSIAVGEIAEERAAKWVVYWTGGATALAAHMYTDTLRCIFGSDGNEVEEKSVDHYIPGFPAIHLSEIQTDITSGNLSSGMGRILYAMMLKLPKADAVVVNTCRTLETSIIATLDQAKFDHKLLCLGPFPLTMTSPSTKVNEDNHGCLPWLEAQLRTYGPSTVAYISFGTAFSLPAEELGALAKALECANVPFLWALPQAHHASLPKGFSEQAAASGKGKIVTWAPQTRVLEHEAVGAFVTHCGWKSVVESVCAQVPMVCRPFQFAEQRLNKGLVERVWGIGVGVEGGVLTEAETAKAIKTVLLGEEGRKMREKIKELRRLVKEGVDESSTTDFLRLMDIIRSK